MPAIQLPYMEIVWKAVLAKNSSLNEQHVGKLPIVVLRNDQKTGGKMRPKVASNKLSIMFQLGAGTQNGTNDESHDLF